MGERRWERMPFKITEECIGCGACVDVCPTEAIVEDGDVFRITEDCAECGSCVDECPNEAIIEVD
jgi:NAD-dependent dihydropyrimidine dehydrogenase PreA subunit